MKEKEAMETKEMKKSLPDKSNRYIPPKITTYTSEEILEQIGPAQTCSPSPCPAFP